jgi:hypothetical protein
VYTRSRDAASCADETALRKAVAARFGYDPFFAWARQTVILQIWREGGKFTARVQLVDEQGLASGTREIQSDEQDCTEVFGAAALAISIALDASAAQSVAAPPAAVEGTPALPPAPTPPAPPPPATSPAPLPFAASPGDTGEDTRPETRPPGPPGPFRGGVGALAANFVGPNIAPGVSLFGGYRKQAFSLDVEIDAAMSLPASQDLPESTPPTGQVASALFAVAVAPCAHYGRAFGCALGEVGWLQAWGWGVDEGGSAGAPVVGLGGRVGVEWPLGPTIFLRAHADVLANLERAVFQLDGQGGWTAPVVGGALGLGVGAALP